MTKITTENCKQFIVQFQKDNPALERIRFGFDPNNNDPYTDFDPDCEYFIDCLDAKKWKRLFKRKPEKEDGTSVYISGQSFNSYAEPAGRVNFDDIKYTRGFDMDTADGQIAYLVFEMKDGTLHIGDYIGD